MSDKYEVEVYLNRWVPESKIECLDAFVTIFDTLPEARKRFKELAQIGLPSFIPNISNENPPETV